MREASVVGNASLDGDRHNVALGNRAVGTTNYRVLNLFALLGRIGLTTCRFGYGFKDSLNFDIFVFNRELVVCIDGDAGDESGAVLSLPHATL